MKLTELEQERAHGHRVLEQPADIGVMTRPGAGSAAELARHRLGEEDALGDLPERGIVDLPGQVLQEALELVRVAIGGRQESGRIDLALVNRLDVLDLRDELTPEALHLARHANRVAAFEARREPVDVAEGAGGDRSG